MDTIALVIGVMGLLGSIPVFLERDKYFEIAKNYFSNEDLIYESLHITYDIKSKEEITVYLTGKLKLKKKQANLELRQRNTLGKIDKLWTKLDNISIIENYYENSEITECENILNYKITNKETGDKIIVEDAFVCKLDNKNKKNLKDCCHATISPYKCKYLNLHIIFPSNFIPLNLSFKETHKKKDNSEQKNHLRTAHYACFADDRKQIQWSIKYPKFKSIYSINWEWYPIKPNTKNNNLKSAFKKVLNTFKAVSK